MLDAVHPWGGRVREFRSSDVVTTVATEPWQLAGYWRLRRDVFCDEQRLFTDSDQDADDARALPIVALSQTAGMPDAVIGVVRVVPGRGAPGRGYSERGSEWYGGRLAVCRAYRRHGVVGERLIRAAVGTALGLGCSRFFATVQLANVRYFERHHFVVVGGRVVCGVPHALMQAELGRFGSLPAGAAA